MPNEHLITGSQDNPILGNAVQQGFKTALSYLLSPLIIFGLVTLAKPYMPITLIADFWALTSFLMIASSFISGAVYRDYSYYFTIKIEELKNPENWTPLDRQHVQIGLACKNNLLYWLHPRAYTPAAYLAYHAKAKELPGTAFAVEENMDEIEIRDFDIDEVCAKKLRQLIERARKPIKLSLINCNLSDERLKQILPDDIELKLSELNLSHNRLGEAGLLHIIRRNLKPLRALNLSDNYFTGTSIDRLRMALQDNTSITTLDINNIHLDETDWFNTQCITLIQKHIQDNQAIAQLEQGFVHKDGEILFDLSQRTIDEELTRIVKKMLTQSTNNCFTRVQFPKEPFSSKFLALFKEFIFHQTNNLTQIEGAADPELQRLARFKRLIQKIMNTPKTLMFKYTIAALAATLTGLVTTAIFSQFPYGALFNVVLSLGIFVASSKLYEAFSYVFKHHLHLLMQPEYWNKYEIEEAKCGYAAKASTMAWINPNAWTPAAYLAYHDTKHDVLPEGVELTVRPRPRTTL